MVARVRERGIGVCLRLGLICRPTREEAASVVEALLPEDRQESTTASQRRFANVQGGAAVTSDAHWLNRFMLDGLVPHYGPVWTTLLGIAKRTRRGLSCIQGNRRQRVHHLRLAGGGCSGYFRPRGSAARQGGRAVKGRCSIETDTNLRFHWMLPKGGEVAMKTAQETSRVLTTERRRRPRCRTWRAGLDLRVSAEESGIESVLLSFSRYEPDTILIACAVGRATTKLKFIVAYRMGLMQPTTFVQQINTLSGLIGGRVALNVVAGSSTEEQHGYGDFLEHDERYARAEEFLAICHAFWRNDGEVDFEGKYCRIERGKLHTPFLAPDRTAPEIYVSGHSEQAQRLALTRVLAGCV